MIIFNIQHVEHLPQKDINVWVYDNLNKWVYTNDKFKLTVVLYCGYYRMYINYFKNIYIGAFFVKDIRRYMYNCKTFLDKAVIERRREPSIIDYFFDQYMDYKYIGQYRRYRNDRI